MYIYLTKKVQKSLNHSRNIFVQYIYRYTMQEMRDITDELVELMDALLAMPQPADEKQTQDTIRQALEQQGIDYGKKNPRSNLLQHINNWITDLPTSYAGLKRFGLKRTYAALSAIGRALSYVNRSDETHMANIKQLRKAIQVKYGKEYGLDLIAKGQLSDSERTRKRNVANKDKRDKRHEDPYTISLPRIQDLLDKLVRDISSGSPMYEHAPVLLAELALGSRIGENVNAAKFALAPPPASGAYELVQQTGVLKKRKEGIPYSENVPDGQGGGARDSDVDDAPDEEEYVPSPDAKEEWVKDAKLVKPCLPGVSAAFVLKALKRWRKDHDQTPGIYRPSQVRKYGPAVNKLLRARYLKPAAGDKVKTVSHLLRAIYANACYEALRGKLERGLTKNAFITKYLGHGSMDIGLSYAHVDITADRTAKDPEDPDPDEVEARLDDDNGAQDDGGDAREEKAGAPLPPAHERPDNLEEPDAVPVMPRPTPGQPEDEEDKTTELERSASLLPQQEAQQPAAAPAAQLQPCACVAQSDAALAQRVAKLEQNQRILVALLQGLQAGLAQIDFSDSSPPRPTSSAVPPSRPLHPARDLSGVNSGEIAAS